jgi:hypothetical protein
VLEGRHNLVLEFVTGTAAAGSFRATALDHEIRNHAVKTQAIVVFAHRQIDEVRHRHRCLVGKQPQMDGPAGGDDMGLQFVVGAHDNSCWVGECGMIAEPGMKLAARNAPGAVQWML